MTATTTRPARLRALIADKECSHVLITDPLDVRYISGFFASQAHILITPKRYLLIADFRYKQSAQDFCHTHKPWRYVPMQQEAFSYLKELISDGAKIGIQSNSLTLDQFTRMRKQCPQARFKRLAEGITTLTTPKEKHEIAAIAQAAAIADRALTATIKKIKTGLTELDVRNMLEDNARRFGSEKPSFDTMVLFGSNSALVHGHPSLKKLADGDWMLFDFGCMVDNFMSDMTRTYVFGRASDRQKKLHAIVFQAQAAACACARAGILACDIDAAARTIINNAGYEKQFGHATGHGIGLRIHEPPRLSFNTPKPVELNTVFSIEPGIYIPSFGGVRIEDLVVAQENGIRLLSHSPRQLLEIGR